MDCVFHMYMQQEDKAMVMTLYMTVVKQHSQHIMTPTITKYMTVVKQLTSQQSIRQSSYHYLINHCDAIPTDIMWPSELKNANRSKA
jgi:hypothetical protein